MATLAEFRKQYPEYDSWSDAKLADALHKKFYSDMPRAEFNKQIAFDPKTQQAYTPAPAPAPKPVAAPAAAASPEMPGFFSQLGRSITSGLEVLKNYPQQMAMQAFAPSQNFAAQQQDIFNAIDAGKYTPKYKNEKELERAKMTAATVAAQEAAATGVSPVAAAADTQIAIDEAAFRYFHGDAEEKAALRAKVKAIQKNITPEFNKAVRSVEDLNKRIAPLAPVVQRVADIDSFAGARNYLGGVLGQSLTQLPLTIAGGVVGGPAGAAGVSGAMSYSEETKNRLAYIQDQVKNLPPEEQANAIAKYLRKTNDVVLMSAAVQGALDAFGPVGTAIKKIFFKELGKEGVEALVREGTRQTFREALKTEGKEVIKAIPKEMGEEFLTGGAQELTSMAGEHVLGEEKGDFFTSKNMSRVLESAFAEAVGSLAGSGVNLGINLTQNRYRNYKMGKAEEAAKAAAEAAGISIDPEVYKEFKALANTALRVALEANPKMSREEASKIIENHAEALLAQATQNVAAKKAGSAATGETNVDTGMDVTGGTGASTDLAGGPGETAVGTGELGATDTGRMGRPVPSVPVSDVGTRAGEPALITPTAAQVKATVPTIEQTFADNAIDFEDTYGVKKLNAEQKKQAARIVIQSPEVDPYDAIGSVLERGQRLRGEKAAPKQAPTTSRTTVNINGQEQVIETPNTTEGVAQLGTQLGQLGVAPEEQPTPTVADTVTEEKLAPTLYHGGRSGLTLDDINIVREPGATKQGKKNRVYGGFYATANPEEAQGYADMAGEGNTVYEIKLRPDAVVEEKEGDITRLSPQQIEEYRARGVDVVVGKDVRGRTEHAIINKDAVIGLKDVNAAPEVALPTKEQLLRNPRGYGRVIAEQQGLHPGMFGEGLRDVIIGQEPLTDEFILEKQGPNELAAYKAGMELGKQLTAPEAAPKGKKPKSRKDVSGLLSSVSTVIRNPVEAIQHGIYRMADAWAALTGKSTESVAKLTDLLSDPNILAKMNPAQRELAAALAAVIDNDVNVYIGNKNFTLKEAFTKGLATFEDNAAPDVRLRGISTKEHIKTLLHEAVHIALISKFGFEFVLLKNIDQNTASPEMLRLRNEAFKIVTAYDAMAQATRYTDFGFPEYGMTHLDEFIAEGLSNPKFQTVLEKGNLWTRFTQFIRNLLGLPPKFQPQLNDVLKAGMELIAGSKNLERMGNVEGERASKSKPSFLETMRPEERQLWQQSKETYEAAGVTSGKQAGYEVPDYIHGLFQEGINSVNQEKTIPSRQQLEEAVGAFNADYFEAGVAYAQEQAALAQQKEILNRMKKAPGKTARQKLFAIMAEDAKKEVDAAVARNDTPEEAAEDLGISPYDPLYDEIIGQAGLDTERLLKLQIAKYKGSPYEMASVIAKELLQNSHDATRKAIVDGLITQGKIDITISADRRTITIYDNGVGMSGELLAQAFLKLGSTGKTEGQNSGGFGMAKSLLLYGTDKADVITANNGKISTLDTSGQQMFDAALAATTGDMSLQPRIKVRDFTQEDYAMFPEGHGTIVQLLVPEEDTDPITGNTVKVDQLPRNYYDWDYQLFGLTFSPLFANTVVTYNGRDIPIGANFPLDEYKTFARVELPFGTADIYITRETSKNPGVHVLSDGVWQFSKRLKGFNNKELPYKIYMNFVPFENIKPDSAVYPFNEQRKNFSNSGEESFNKLASLLRTTFGLGSFLDNVQSFGNIQYYDPDTGMPGAPIDLTPEIPQDVIDRLEKAATGDESQIKIGSDGRVEVNGNSVDVENIDQLKKALPSANELIIDQSKIDADRVMLHDAADVIVTDPNTGAERQVPIVEYMRERFGDRIDQYFFFVGTKFNELRNEVVRVMEAKYPGQYQALLSEAIGISLDPRYRGVSTKVPFSGMFLNPLVPEATDAFERLEGIVTTMIHELAHYKERSHDAGFPAEMQRIQAALKADRRRQGFDFNRWVDDFVDEIVDAGYSDIIDAGQYLFATKEDRENGTYGSDPQYTNARVVYRGGRFADHSIESVSERGAQGEGTTEDNGANGAGGTGGESLLGPSFEGRKGAGRRGNEGRSAQGGKRRLNAEVEKAVGPRLTKAQMRRIEEAAGIRSKNLNNMQKRIVQSRNDKEVKSLIKRLTSLARGSNDNVGILASLMRSIHPKAYQFLLAFTQTEDVFRLGKMAGIKALEKINTLMEDGYYPYVNRIIARADKISRMWTDFASKDPEGAAALDDAIMYANMHNMDPSLALTAADYMRIDPKLKELQDRLRQERDPKKRKPIQDQIGKRKGEIQRGYFTGELKDPDGKTVKDENGKPVQVAGWNAVPPEGRRIFKAARDFHRANLNAHYGLLMQRIDDAELAPNDAVRLKTAIEKMFAEARERVFYAPVRRFGEHWLSVGDDFYTRESMQELEALRKKLKASGETREISTSFTKDTLRKKIGGSGKDASAALKGILDSLDQANTVGENGKAKIEDIDDVRDLLFQMYLMALPEADMRRRFIHRQFKTGFSTDAARSFADTAVASANQLGRLAYNYKLQNMLDEAYKEAEGNPLKPWMDTITLTIKKHVDSTIAPQNNSWANIISSVLAKAGFLWNLTSPSSALINFTQLHVFGLPVLSAEFGEPKTYAMATRYTTSFLAGREIPNPMRDEDGNLTLQVPEFRFENSAYMRSLKKDDPERYEQTMAAWQYAKEHEVIENTFSAGSNVYTASNVPTGKYNLRQALRRGELGTATKQGVISAVNSMGFLFHTTEKIGRSIMYMSSFDLAYERAIKQGKTPEEAGKEARELAVKLTNKGMFNFSNWNKSLAAKHPVGRVALQMTSYIQSMTSLMVRSFVGMLPFLNKEGKLAAARIFFGSAAMTALYGGLRATQIGGMLVGGYTLLKWVESLFEGDDDDDKDKEAKEHLLSDKTVERELLKYADEHGNELTMKDIEYYIKGTWINDTFGAGSNLQKVLGLSDENAAKLAKVADMGLPALAGVDISGSVSMGDLWHTENLRSDTAETRALELMARKLLGPSSGPVLAPFKVMDAMNNGDIDAAIEAGTPAALRNYFKSQRLQREGLVIGKDKDIILKDPSYYTPAKVWLQALGFRDAETSRNLKLDMMKGEIEKSVAEEKTDVLDQRYRAILAYEKNPSKENLHKWALSERAIDVYNLNYPSNAITDDDMKKSFEGKARDARIKQYGLDVNPKIPVAASTNEERWQQYLRDKQQQGQ